MNRKALKAADYAHVRVLPYPIRYDRHGGELPPPLDDMWIMKVNEKSVRLDCQVGMWTVDVSEDFIDSWSDDSGSPPKVPNEVCCGYMA
jgi:hypothetical protein